MGAVVNLNIVFLIQQKKLLVFYLNVEDEYIFPRARYDGSQSVDKVVVKWSIGKESLLVHIG